MRGSIMNADIARTLVGVVEKEVGDLVRGIEITGEYDSALNHTRVSITAEVWGKKVLVEGRLSDRIMYGDRGSGADILYELIKRMSWDLKKNVYHIWKQERP